MIFSLLCFFLTLKTGEKKVTWVLIDLGKEVGHSLMYVTEDIIS